MTRRAALALAVAGVLVAAGTAGAAIRKTELSAPHIVRARDLIGLTPAQAQARLMGFDADWPRAMGLEVATEGGVLAFVALEDLLQDAAGHELLARGRNSAFGPGMPKAWSSCQVGPGDETLLMFRNGGVEGLWSARDLTPEARATAETPLPFQDGEAFFQRWGRKPLSADTELSVSCAHFESTPDPATQNRRGGLTASDMQGLALLPFAVELPFMNAGRTANRRRGVALYETLSPGASLPGGLRSFAAANGGVRVVRSPDPDYAILKIDLGAYASNNLSNFDDIGLVGVRKDVVVWRALDYARAAPRLPAKAPR